MSCSGLSVNPNCIAAVPPRWPEALGSDEVVVRVGPAVAVELPRLADLGDLVQVEVAHDQLLVVRAAEIAHELPTRISEVRLAVEVVVADVLLDPDAVDRADEVAVRDGVRHLLDPPQVFA